MSNNVPSQISQAEKELTDRLHYVSILSKISSRTVETDNLDDFLNFSLTELGQSIDVSRTYIFEHFHDTETMDNTYEWCAPGILPQIDELKGVPSDAVQWWTETLKSNNIICYSDIEDIPDTVSKEILRPQKVISILVVPLFAGGRYYGFIGFDDCIQHRSWPEEDVDILKSISRIISGVIERQNAENTLKESERKYRTLFETMTQGVVYQNSEGRVTSVNPSAERILGQSLNQLNGEISADPRWHTIHEDGSPFPAETHPAMLALQSGKDSSAIMGVFNPKANKYTWIKVNAKPEFKNRGKNPYQVCTTFEDITALKETLEELYITNRNLENRVEQRTSEIQLAMESLRKSEERFHRIFYDHAAVMLLINPDNGIITEANKAAEHFYGYNFSGKNKKHIEDINILSPEQIKLEMEIALQRNRNYFIFPHKLASGIIRTVEVHSSPIEVRGEKVLFSIIHDITERKQAEDEIKRQSGLITSLLDSIPDIIFYKDVNGVYLGCNPTFAEFAGKKRSEIIGSTDYDLFDKEEADYFRENDEKMLQRLQSRKNEEWITYPDGRKILIDTLKTPYWGKDGSLIGLLGISRDITDRKKAEDELQETMQKLTILIQNLQTGTLFENTNRQITLVNQSFCNLFGIPASPEQMIGFDCEAASESSKLLMKDPDGFINRITETISQGKIVTNEEIFLLNGQVFERDYIPIKYNNNLMGHLWHYRDITHLKKADAALKMQCAAFESFALAIIITDIKGVIKWANSSFTKLTGYSVNEALGKRVGELTQSGNQNEGFYKDFWDTILRREVWSGELINRKKDGTLYFEEETITPVLDFDGKILSFIAIKIDITERKKFEKSLHEALEREKELNVLKSKFISIASHEFQTPLATILATSESLTSYWDRMTKEQREQRHLKIRNQVDHLSNYIREMLHLSKLQAKEQTIEPEEFNIVELFQQIIDEHRLLSGEPNQIIFKTKSSSIFVFLDKKEIGTILNNLLSNALKYSEPGSPIKVCLGHEKKNVFFTIKDYGIGIKEEEIKNLFEPFYRTSNVGNISGTGLGLSIVKESVDRHNGKLTVKSKLNKGTEFILELPHSINH